MPDPATATSSFYPDISQADPKEESEANKRALTLGLLTAGIGILSHPFYKGQSVVAPIAQGLGAGLETYEGVLKDAADQQVERHKQALEAYKDKIAQERADAYDKRQQDLEQEGLARDKETSRRDDISQQKADEAERAHQATEGISQQRADVSQQQADTAGRRADTAASVESARWDPVGANSPIVQRFDRYRSIPGMEKYMSVAYPPETLAGMTQMDLKKADDNIRKEYLNTQKGKTTYFNGADGMRHMVTIDATGDTKDTLLGAVPTPGTDKDAKTKDFTEYKAEGDGSKTPWTVTRNMSIPGNPVINVQPLKGHSYGWIYKDPDSIPKPQDFPGLSPSITGRIGSKPGTGTAGPAVAPEPKVGDTVTPTAGPHAGKTLKRTATGYVEVPTGGEAAARGSAGGAGAGGAPGAPAAPAGKPVLYTEGGVHRNKATGEYLFKMPDGSWGWAKTPNGDGIRPSGAAGV